LTLDARHAEFIRQDGISINLASRAEGNAPVVARAVGCRVSADAQRVTVLVASAQYTPLVEAVRASGALAAVFSLPRTHETIQLKAVDARLASLAPGDAELARRHMDSFAAGLAALGYGEDMVRAFVWCDPGELAAIEFTPSAAFLQTPGPGAGTPIKG
jgi:hypothetical protein